MVLIITPISLPSSHSSSHSSIPPHPIVIYPPPRRSRSGGSPWSRSFSHPRRSGRSDRTMFKPYIKEAEEAKDTASLAFRRGVIRTRESVVPSNPVEGVSSVSVMSPPPPPAPHPLSLSPSCVRSRVNARVSIQVPLVPGSISTTNTGSRERPSLTIT